MDPQLHHAAQAGIVQIDGAGRYHFTPEGRRYVARLMRGHRLWELFLTEYAELAKSYAELDAESVDERLPAETISELEQKLRAAGRWPEVRPA